jgi:hypothetical protein
MRPLRGITIAAATVAFLAAPATLAAAPVAQAASVSATAHHSPKSSRIHWVYYGSYPTLHACNVEGDYLEFYYNVTDFRCIPASGGEYIYYQLWLGYAG